MSDLNVDCNASFAGDSDIGGIGVLTSYIVFSTVTTVVTGLNVLTPPTRFRDQFRSWLAGENSIQHTPESVMLSMGRRRFWLHEFSRAALSSLCEIQLLTSIGIVLAGLIQIRQLSFYHLDIINNLWWLTFTSFWAVSTPDRVGHSPVSRRLRRIFDREQIHTVLMVVSVGLAVGYQLAIIDLMAVGWDSETPGRCFRYDHWFDWQDHFFWFNEYFWIFVLCAFMLQAILSLNSTMDEWLMKIDPWLAGSERRLISTHWTLMERLQIVQQPHGPTSLTAFWRVYLCLTSNPLQWVRNLVMSVINSVVFLSQWMLRQSLSIAGLVDGTRAITFPFYIIYLLLNAGYLVSTKLINKPLVSDESKWGFGQILPMVLILALGYQVLDAVESGDRKTFARDLFLKNLDCDYERREELEDLLTSKKFARPMLGELYSEARAIETQAAIPV